jgi:DNA-directed RNA polymerase specialized sigma54-like protein
MKYGTVTHSQIAEKLGMHRSSIHRRAKKEQWPCKTGKNRTKCFYVSSLPPGIRERVAPDFSGTLNNEVCSAFETEVTRMIKTREKDNETLKRIRLLLDRVEQ